MKIAFIGTKELSLSGNREKQMRPLASRLVRRGWEVTCYVPTTRPVLSLSEAEGIRVVHVPDGKGHLPFRDYLSLSIFHAFFQNYQILQCPALTGREKLAILALKICAPGTKLIVESPEFFQGIDPEDGETNSKLSVRSFAVWPKRYILAERALCGDRHLHTLIRAFLELEEHNRMPNNYKLVIIGHQSDLAEYRPYLKILAGQNTNIHFVEEFKEEERSDRTALFSQAALYVYLADSPTLPQGLLNAMAHGVPPLVFQAPSVRPLTEKGCAVPVVSHSIEDLKGAMAHYINLPQEAELIGRKAKKHVEDYHSWEVLAERVSDTYRQVLKNHSLKEYVPNLK